MDGRFFLLCVSYQGEGIMGVIGWLMQPTTEALAEPFPELYGQILSTSNYSITKIVSEWY